MMKPNKLTTACAAALLALGLAACSSDNDTVKAPVEPVSPSLTELQIAQNAVKKAKEAATTAATNAKTAADNAKAASNGRASIQTSDLAGKNADGVQMNAAGYADAAGKHATMAKAAETKAIEAYNDAMAEDATITDAVMAQAKAKDAKMDAEEHAGMAAAKKALAENAAAMDLKWSGPGDDLVATVGTTSITFDGMTRKELIGGEAVDVGMIGAVTRTGSSSGAADRDLEIGEKYLSNDGSTLFKVVNHYLTTMDVDTFSDNGPAGTGTKPNEIVVNNATYTLTEEGFHWRTSNDVIGSDEERQTLYSYKMGGTTKYVYWVRTNERTTHTANNDPTTVTTYVYRHANVGNMPTKLPVAKQFSHVAYGLWAPYDGMNPSNLGIAFADERRSGDGMTEAADMPNFGSAMYMGGYLATVRDATEHKVVQNEAMLNADFAMNTVMLDLTGLATDLKGTISDGSFGGSGMATKDDIDYAGSFTGSFFGSMATEAGGVFNYMSKADGSDGNLVDGEMGAFRGSFGAAR